jgi:hypothetical protein
MARGVRAAALAIAALAAAAPAVAQAGPRVEYYRQSFTTPVPGKSTGLDTQILYRHPDDPNAKPIPLRQEVFTFPAGVEFDDSVVPDCAAPETDMRVRGGAACPAASWLGGGLGDTSMTGFPGAGETLINVNAFDFGGGEFRVIAGPEGFPLRWIARGRREGRVSTVDVPQTPGGPPDGEGALRRIHNYFPPHSLGNKAWARTPRACPRSGTWLFKLRATFADGVVENYSHRMRCRRHAPRRTAG